MPHFCIQADFLSGPVSVPHLGHHDASQKVAAKNGTMSESMSGPGVYMQHILYQAILTVNTVTKFGGTYKLAQRRILWGKSFFIVFYVVGKEEDHRAAAVDCLMKNEGYR